MIEYRIYQKVYNEIIAGRKNIEVRLLNDKSEKIKIGDKIKFQVDDNGKSILVEVTNKYLYEDFEEFWQAKDIVLNSAKNYTKEECKNTLFEIFGEEKVKKSKIVGIEFKLLK